MVNLKYNAINFIKVLLSALNLLLMLRIFGASNDSDIYLVASSLILSWHYIPLLFLGQFIQFYNDIKVKSEELSAKFYNQSLVFSLCIGLILFFIIICFLDKLVHLYTINIDQERFVELINLLKIMSLSVIFAPIVTLTEQLLIAENQIMHAYNMHILIVALPVIGMVSMLLFNNPNILTLGSFYSFGIMTSALYGIFICNFKLISFKYYSLKEFVTSEIFKKFVSNSFTIYSSNAIGTCLLPVVLNNFLVNFSNGVISCFYYSKNAIEAVNLISTDYYTKKLSSQLSSAISRNNIEDIKNSINSYIKLAPLVFFGMAVAIYFAIPLGFKILFFNSELKIDVILLRNIFASLVPWYLAYLFNFAYYSVNLYLKKSFIVLLGNIVFIVIFGLTSFLNRENIYVISGGFFLAQTAAFIVYYMTSKSYHNRQIGGQNAKS